ncbi:MAG: hypothetical protein UV65_C0024G0001 [Parcubacteria group bacterium GW2011_GWF2_43_11]|nr:MAG: hypothetical protein UV65_C0024G0001 [Parcubacteria group bacterium GW2011_GWF2_43_11]
MVKKYLTIKEVAKVLGVTPLTLRNWDKAGKLKLPSLQTRRDRSFLKKNRV